MNDIYQILGALNNWNGLNKGVFFSSAHEKRNIIIIFKCILFGLFLSWKKNITREVDFCSMFISYVLFYNITKDILLG